jgi:proteasome lid subunit RPN8/RPN11
MDLLQDMVDHARRDAPNEACGLVVAFGRRHRLVRARNVSEAPVDTFEIDEDAWLQVEEGEEVVGIYHSHPRSSPQPSPADLTMCEVTGVPWHIVDLIGGYTCTNPSGYVAPYTKRPYVYGVHDCYSIARDWYNREWDLGIPDFDRQHEWWERGENLFVDNFESVGFVSIPREQPKIGDAFLFQVSSKVPNHVAVYIGNGLILHHVRFRLSCQELYGGLWAKTTTHQLRHTSRIPSHG